MTNLTSRRRFTKADFRPHLDYAAADPLSAIRREINTAYSRALATGDQALRQVALFLLADMAIRRRQVGLDDPRLSGVLR